MPIPDLPLPRDWPLNVRSAMLHTVSPAFTAFTAFTAITHSRSWAVNSPLEGVRLAGELDRARNAERHHGGPDTRGKG